MPLEKQASAMMTRITLYSAPSITDERDAAVSVREVADSEVHETLRQIGLEWKTADYMTQRQVVITLDPIEDSQQPDVRGCVRRAAELLEETGLL